MRSSPMPALLAVLLITLTACQPVPRAFERTANRDNGLLRLAYAPGIMVEPVTAAPSPAAHGLAREMVAALIDRGVPAYIASRNRSSMTLVSRVVDPGQDAHISWVLYDRNGVVIGQYDQSIEGAPIAPWATGDTKLMATFADSAAPRIAAFIHEEVKGEVIAPAIHVGAVHGAPEAGITGLQAALRTSLRQVGARLAKKPSKETLTASATVKLTPMESGRVEVAIGWVLADPFGVEIGRVYQSRVFAQRVIDNSWSELAREAGLAAAVGMVGVISQINWHNGFARPKTDESTKLKGPQ